MSSVHPDHANKCVVCEAKELLKLISIVMIAVFCCLNIYSCFLFYSADLKCDTAYKHLHRCSPRCCPGYCAVCGVEGGVWCCIQRAILSVHIILRGGRQQCRSQLDKHSIVFICDCSLTVNASPHLPPVPAPWGRRGTPRTAGRTWARARAEDAATTRRSTTARGCPRRARSGPAPGAAARTTRLGYRHIRHTL